MKILFLLSLFSIGVARAQVSKYVIASCVISQMNGKKDTVFNATNGTVTSTLDMSAKSIIFDWKTTDYTAVKFYKVLDQQIIKDKMYETMGVYSMNLKCLNKEGKKCNINFGINSRINHIDIVLTDGEFVLNYRAIQTQ